LSDDESPDPLSDDVCLSTAVSVKDLKLLLGVPLERYRDGTIPRAHKKVNGHHKMEGGAGGRRPSKSKHMAAATSAPSLTNNPYAQLGAAQAAANVGHKKKPEWKG
jgi:hypothetical protein